MTVRGTGFKEDLPALASRAYEVALGKCRGCTNYHIYWPVRRAAGIIGGSDADRVAIVEQIKKIARPRRGGRFQRRNVLISGAADTGILSAVAEGLYAAGGREALDRTSIVVVDRCATPLILCSEYAERHGLDLTISRTDLLAYGPTDGFDLVIVHSVLAFLPETERTGMLARMAEWLRGDGVILLSANMLYRSRADRDRRFDEVILPKVCAAVAGGRIVLQEDEAAFFERCRRRHDGIAYDRSGFATLGEFDRFVERAGLLVDHVEALAPRSQKNAGTRPRLAAVLKRGAGS